VGEALLESRLEDEYTISAEEYPNNENNESNQEGK